MGYTSTRRVRKFSQGSQAVAGGRRRSQAVGSPSLLACGEIRSRAMHETRSHAISEIGRLQKRTLIFLLAQK